MSEIPDTVQPLNYALAVCRVEKVCLAYQGLMEKMESR